MTTENTTPAQAPVQAPAEAPKTTGGVMIQTDKVYAIKGSAILGIVETLRNQLPIRYLDLVLSVENTLATGVPVAGESRPAQ